MGFTYKDRKWWWWDFYRIDYDYNGFYVERNFKKNDNLDNRIDLYTDGRKIIIKLYLIIILTIINF